MKSLMNGWSGIGTVNIFTISPNGCMPCVGRPSSCAATNARNGQVNWHRGLRAVPIIANEFQNDKNAFGSRPCALQLIDLLLPGSGPSTLGAPEKKSEGEPPATIIVVRSMVFC